MLYAVLRWIAGIALRWFYREVDVVGLERIPLDAPVLLAANHPNALIDPLVIGCVVPRPVHLTAKATLAENPAMRLLMRLVGIVPLRRASDERQRGAATALDSARNESAFRAILDALERRGIVLIFPEGISHDEPRLAPIKTGVARIALQARDDRGVRGLQIVPVGLTFERKWQPRTRVLVQVGEPLDVDRWPREHSSADELTAEVERRLRDVTLNFESREDAERVLAVSRVLSGVFDGVRALARPDTPLTDVYDIARRVDLARQAMSDAPPQTVRRIDGFLERLDGFQRELDDRGIAVNDVAMDTAWSRGLGFAVREVAIVLAAGPLALWGRVNHWLPLRLTEAIAQRSSQTPEDPAMHTIVAGLALVLLFYALQTTVVALLGGPWWALAYLVTLPASATWDIVYRDRLRRAIQRTRTYLRFRREPAVQRQLVSRTVSLREEAEALASQLADSPGVR